MKNKDMWDFHCEQCKRDEEIRQTVQVVKYGLEVQMKLQEILKKKDKELN